MTSPAASPPPAPAGLRGRLTALLHEVAKFGVVGLVAMVVDIGLFNLLRFAGPALLADKPLTAKVISVLAAMTVAYLGNRFWTYRDRPRRGFAREWLLFVVFNAIGLGIALVCLFVSHYLLDLRSPLADNLSANVIGLGLGTLFRFWAYRTFVFSTIDEDDALTAELRQPI